MKRGGGGGDLISQSAVSFSGSHNKGGFNFTFCCPLLWFEQQEGPSVSVSNKPLRCINRKKKSGCTAPSVLLDELCYKVKKNFQKLEMSSFQLQDPRVKQNHINASTMNHTNKNKRKNQFLSNSQKSFY